MERLAIMAAERLLLLQPANWTLRRDYGLLLHYARRYRESTQELSICLAFAPVEESEVIEPFFGNERIIILTTLSTSHEAKNFTCGALMDSLILQFQCLIVSKLCQKEEFS